MEILILGGEELDLSALTGDGFRVRRATDRAQVLHLAKLESFDLLVLEQDLTLVRELREQRCRRPVLLLSTPEQDRVECLCAGVNYILSHPWDGRELAAAARMLLPRWSEPPERLEFGSTVLDTASSRLLCGSSAVRLSSRETEILRLLFQSGNRNISKGTILARIWGQNPTAVENHVEIYIGFLRRKLHTVGSDIQIIATRRLGYHLELR